MLHVCKHEGNNALFNEYVARLRPEGLSDERFKEVVDYALDLTADRYYDDVWDWSCGYNGGGSHEGFIRDIVKRFGENKTDFVRDRWMFVACIMFANDLPEDLVHGKRYDNVLNKFRELPSDQQLTNYYPD